MTARFMTAFVAISCAAVVCSGVSPVWAHVEFTAPMANQSLEPGSTVQLAWVDTIPHDTERYELYFLPGSNADTVAIDLDVDPETHTYDWSVPTAECSDCALRVVQVNVAYTDYDSTVPIIVGDAPPEPDDASGSAESSDAPVSARTGTGAEGCHIGAGSRPVRGTAFLAIVALFVGLRRRAC